MSKIISVSLPGSATIHGHALDGAYGATLCRPEPGKRAYVPTTEPETITCKSCAKIIRETSAPEAVSAPESRESDEMVALSALRTLHIYVDNRGEVYGTGSGALTQAVHAALRGALAYVNGASRVTLPNGRAGRRIVLTIAGRNALNV